MDGLGRVVVEGELSSLRRHTSGHVYFDLKDESARLSCVVWRSRVSRALAFDPEEGVQVLAHGRLDVYPPRGSYNLIVERLEPLGLGALLVELERLKEELRAKGWFDRARPLPALPSRVGVVTSRDGAALRDLLRTRSLRWPGFPVRLRHAPVQGPGAANAIARAIDDLDRSGVDVIVVCRGGGSLEDLWAFNERPVAEAVWRASVPVVSGVGHESDTTLIDLVADHRAHTPTDAAQSVIPDLAEHRERLARMGNFLIAAASGRIEACHRRLAELARRPALSRPARILAERRQVLADRGARLRAAANAQTARRMQGLQALQVRLERQAPRLRLERRAARVQAAGEGLVRSLAGRLEGAGTRVTLLARTLEGVSPLAVLGRGYSLTRRAGETVPLDDSARTAVGEELETWLRRGSIRTRVVEVRPPEDGA